MIYSMLDEKATEGVQHNSRHLTPVDAQISIEHPCPLHKRTQLLFWIERCRFNQHTA
jgi:hypothetical protein